MSDNQEQEAVIYAEVGDTAGFNHAIGCEYHTQYETEHKSGSRSRIRLIGKSSGLLKPDFSEELYVSEILYTVKIPQGDQEQLQSTQEYTVSVDRSLVDIYAHAADRVIEKIRYLFESHNVEMKVETNGEIKTLTIPDIIYEVDLYRRPDGTTSKWCKIDVEVDQIIEYLNIHHPEIEEVKLHITVSHLPFLPTNCILPASMTEDQKSFVDNLWRTEFTQPLR